MPRKRKVTEAEASAWARENDSFILEKSNVKVVKLYCEVYRRKGENGKWVVLVDQQGLIDAIAEDEDD